MTAPLTRDELISALAEARRTANLSIRRAAALAKVPSSTAQGWFEGRHLPTPALMPDFLTLLDALDLTHDDAERQQWHRAVTRLRSNEIIEEPPYAGLRSYTVDEALVYVGRERAYETLVGACTQQPITVLVGDSGAGKSSLLAAGLIGTGCAPGGPLAHLTPLSLSPIDLISARLPRSPTLLLIDQFEDTELLPPSAQAHVFDALARLPSNVTCVVALVASSFGFALRDERFAAHLESPVLLGPLTTAEYTRIIVEPARHHGRHVSPELIQLAISDLHRYGDPKPGTTLPLLSSALRRCWRHASGVTLEAADYSAVGGLWSALHDEAETTYLSLSAGQQSTARRLLLAMVHIDDEHISRRKIGTVDLDDELNDVVDAFLSARLFTRSEDAVVISHDALLANWQRLKEWIDDEKATLAIARRIQLAAQLWDEGGRNPETLMPIEAEAWSTWAEAESTPILSARERAFIDNSLALAESQQREDATTIIRLKRRQYSAIAAATIAAVLAVATTTATLTANRYRHEAEIATVNAQSRQVALIADELRPLAPNTAAQLSVASLAMADSVQTRSAVLTSAATHMPTRIAGSAGNTMVAHAVTADLIVRADSTGTITLWPNSDLTAEPTSIASGGQQLFTLSITEVKGRTLALVGGQKTAGIWDLTGEPIKLGDYGADTVTYSSSWHENVVHIGTLTGEIRRIDFSDPTSPSELDPISLGAELAVSSLNASAHGIFAGGIRDVVEVFDHDGAHLTSLPISGTALTMSLSPDGTELLIGSAGNNATLWDLTGSAPTHNDTIELPGLAHSVYHAGDRLIIAGAFGAIHEYGPDHELVANYPERATVVGLDVEGTHILAGAVDGATTRWDTAPNATVLSVPDGVALYDIVNGGDALLVGTSAGARVMALRAGAWVELEVADAPAGASYTYWYAISDDGSVLVNQTSAGDLITLDRSGDSYTRADVLPDQATIMDIRLSPTGRYLALGYRGTEGYSIYERSEDSWQLLREVHAWPAYSAFNDSETLFAAMNYEGNGVAFWDLAVGGEEPLSEARLPDDVAPGSMDFAPNDDLAVGDSRGEISIFSLADPARPVHLHQLRDARSSLTQVSYSPDGDHVLAATGEGQLWVWSTDGDFPLTLQLTPGDGPVSGAMWFDGDIVMSSGDRAIAWPGDPLTAAAEMCTRFGTGLTAEEWARLVPDVDPVDGCAAFN